MKSQLTTIDSGNCTKYGVKFMWMGIGPRKTKPPPVSESEGESEEKPPIYDPFVLEVLCLTTDTEYNLGSLRGDMCLDDIERYVRAKAAKMKERNLVRKHRWMRGGSPVQIVVRSYEDPEGMIKEFTGKQLLDGRDVGLGPCGILHSSIRRLEV
jgi:hypothetical protein